MKNDEAKIEENEFLAGDFSSWLMKTRDMLMNNSGAEVPCGSCRACCTSSHFIHIKPEEKQTLKVIDRRLLFDAPGLPKGNVLLGYSKNGHCPMFADNKCSIYSSRPFTCKNYDCRIYVAAGIDADYDPKGLITKQIKLWKFNYITKDSRELHLAVQQAAKFIKENPELFPNETIPQRAGELAILALKVYEVFFDADIRCKIEPKSIPNKEIAKRIVELSKRFEKQN